jgi:hypothetical protein
MFTNLNATTDSETTFHNVGIPYLQQGALRIRDGAEVTFEAGIEYRLGVDSEISVAYTGASSLVVQGTAADPVTFRGDSAESGFWHGIRFQNTALSSTALHHTRILHGGGGGNAALWIGAPILLDNVTLDENETGANIGTTGLDPDSSMLSITGTSGIPMTADSNALVTIPSDGLFSGNEIDRVEVVGPNYTAAGTVPDLGVPYLLQSDLRLRDGAAMTIAAGTEFIATGDVSVNVGYTGAATLIAEGTESAPIVFRGLDDVSGYWQGLFITAAALSATALDYVEIRNAGQASGQALRIAKNVDVTNTTVAGSLGDGITYDDAFAARDYETPNSFSDIAGSNVSTF